MVMYVTPRRVRRCGPESTAALGGSAANPQGRKSRKARKDCKAARPRGC